MASLRRTVELLSVRAHRSGARPEDPDAPASGSRPAALAGRAIFDAVIDRATRAEHGLPAAGFSTGQSLFAGLMGRALEAQRGAPPEQRGPLPSAAGPDFFLAELGRLSEGERAAMVAGLGPHVLAPAAIAAEVKRLTDEERASLLAYLAAVEAYGRDHHRNNHFRDAFKAVLGNCPPVTPDVATDFFLAYARFVVPAGLAGFRKVVELMERQGGAAVFAGPGPLRDAYAALRDKYPVLAESRIDSADLEARVARLLGLDGAVAEPGGDTDASASDNDGPHVDAYVAALEGRLSEITAWDSAMRAHRPEYLREAAEACGHVAPTWPGDWRYLRDVPLACLSRLDPPPPAWFLAPAAAPTQSQTARLRSYRPAPGTYAVLSWIPRFPGLPGSSRFDRAWLARAREANRAALHGWTGHDWSGEEVVAPDLLRVSGAGDDGALRELVWRARSAAPNKRWLDDAGRLLSSSTGASAVAAAARWIELATEPRGSVPTPTAHRLAGVFRSFCDHAREVLAAHGGDAGAAAMSEIRGGGVFGQEPDGSCDLRQHEEHRSILSEQNETVLRGCVWLLAVAPGAGTVERLARLALGCMAQAPAALDGVKYRSLKGLNACVWALGRIAAPEAVAALGRVKLEARDERIAKQVAKAMAEAAERAGMSVEELEEVAVPAFGLEGRGRRAVALAGGVSAELSVVSGTEAAVAILRADGKPAKSVPAAVKADAEGAAALKELKAAAKELSQALPVHRLRLERSWLTGRTWSGRRFRERLLDHPLMGWFAARLVWSVAPAEGGGPARTCFFPDGGSPVDAEDRPAPRPRDDDRVSLWHPLSPAEPDAVRLWRAFLPRHRVVQPIKQAHREVYPLTPAEEATATYSNRFAGHILRQHQSAALARLRGWSVRLRISADVPNDEPTHIKMPAHGLAAEFWTEAAGGDDAEFTDSLAYLFIGTDRVRFRRLVDNGDRRRDGGRHLALAAEAVPLRDVPPVVLSEVMRDVDLLVGVSSIGHDPAWLDGGAGAEHPNRWRRGAATDYWHSFNAAELTQSAQERRSFLAELLPKLAIADRCELAERHLVVRGRLRTYRIHLGSGNIAMEPDGRHLCIVEKRGGAEPEPPGGAGVFLPFKGDRLLSTILSKAFLLARDDRIADPTILRQVGA